MKITDKCSMRNKRVEKKLRELESLVDQMENAGMMKKETFISTFVLILELLIEAYKTLEDNTTPGKTLLEYSQAEIKSACNRVGVPAIFMEDSEYVMAVMKELTK